MPLIAIKILFNTFDHQINAKTTLNLCRRWILLLIIFRPCSTVLNVIQKIITNLLTDRLTWQNFFLNSHLRLVNNCLESIYKTQKTKMNVLPCETIDEYMICIWDDLTMLKFLPATQGDNDKFKTFLEE